MRILFRSTRTLVCSLAILLGGAGGSLAQTEPAEPGSDWEFVVSPYFWFASLEGKVATVPGLPTADVEASFSDILDNLNIGFMTTGEARKDRFGVVVDLVYLDLTADGNTPGPLFSGVEADLKQFFGTLSLAYRAVESEDLFLDVMAGARLWVVDTELSLRPGLLPRRSTDHTETWVDPIVGLRLRVPFAERFYAAGYGDVGGFDLSHSSDHTFQLYGGVGYQIRDWASVEVGYRYLSVDYEDDGFVNDVTIQGPVIGGRLRF